MSTRYRILSLAILLFPLAGCGSTSALPTADASDEAALQQVGEMLRDYQLSNGAPPHTLKQLQANAGASPGGVEQLRSSGVVVIWGATLPDTKEEPGGSPDEDVLAYGKDAPEKGGAVLLLNRTVRTMTADEFKAAPKAKSSAPPAKSPSKARSNAR
ncbi:hypothetical protein [Paludisphaera borealis]|uniref:Uncharacterized protein n=1 Tax=Paludisphaera borealis TaxID=1387353 RepID=A0A1U7CQ47_9BACT|nr:hypothetical protein [Paludisphaera borealis]APW61052.1 hypothetical protein BSF38_02555 [Paludisphaera borealis]